MDRGFPSPPHAGQGCFKGLLFFTPYTLLAALETPAERQRKAWLLHRSDVDEEQDAQVFAPESDDNVVVRHHAFQRGGPMFFMARGSVWREEWVEPADRSVRIRRDPSPETFSYIVTPSGDRMNGSDLSSEDVSRYLWFRPSVVMALLAYRQSSLVWFSQNTGSVAASPHRAVHFGVDRTGHINVYACDVARLPTWVQRIWHGANVTPTGPVSSELTDAQQKASPASTSAPEQSFVQQRADLDAAFQQRFGSALFTAHADTEALLARIHRFRAGDRHGLLELAKDLARVTADMFNVKPLRAIVAAPNGEKPWGSMTNLRHVLASISDEATARAATKGIQGIYDLRLGDAHPASSRLSDAFALAGIDEATSPLEQGTALIQTAVQSLAEMTFILKH